jgi:hypothetical protein
VHTVAEEEREKHGDAAAEAVTHNHRLKACVLVHECANGVGHGLQHPLGDDGGSFVRKARLPAPQHVFHRHPQQHSPPNTRHDQPRNNGVTPTMKGCGTAWHAMKQSAAE